MEVLRIASRDTVLLCAITGDMTLEACEAFQEQLEQAAADKDHQALVLDLSLIRLMDSTGISSLIRLETQLRAGGKRLVLFKPNTVVLQTLKLVRLDSFFQIIADKYALLALLPELIDANCSI